MQILIINYTCSRIGFVAETYYTGPIMLGVSSDQLSLFSIMNYVYYKSLLITIMFYSIIICIKASKNQLLGHYSALTYRKIYESLVNHKYKSFLYIFDFLGAYLFVKILFLYPKKLLFINLLLV